jgi:membrane protein implicated in regulation of membrane protease activity
VAALVWLVAGILLAAAEALSGDFVLLMLAGGALGAAGISAVAGDAYLVQAAVFAVVSVALVAGVRPPLKRRALRGPDLAVNVAALVGREAEVLELTSSDAGQVKLSGEVWTARSASSADVFDPGQIVRVVQIDGATAVVGREI